MRFLDANIILRYLTDDIPQKAERCLSLFQRADEGEIELTTSETIIAEVVYVLSSPKLYDLAPERIRDLLLPILDLKGLKLPASHHLYHQALELYATQGIDFEDALAVAHMRDKEIDEILSYDQHFDRIESITRVEP